ncbi:MAG: esterase family protein [Treponema sp.]|nr:esterase family protein [Treponema sp.]
MKKTKLLFFACGIITILLSAGCASKATNNSATTTKKGETEKMDYITKYQIKNEITVDCPEEVMTMRPEVFYSNAIHKTYYSNTCKMERGVSILLPASYDGEKKYPVVYFQHGIFGDEYSMTGDPQNKFKEIAANLAADGNAKEMIIVFGNMYATDDPAQKPGFDPKAVLPYDNFINELINDLMPYIESNYSVLTGRENTAICGFSMGGRETLYIGLKRPDLFGYVGAIAPAPGLVPAKDWAMSHGGMLENSQLKYEEDGIKPELLMVCCGTNDSVVGQFPKSYHKIFVENGTEHLWFEVMTADHNAHAIRTGFYQFATRIFK